MRKIIYVLAVCGVATACLFVPQFSLGAAPKTITGYVISIGPGSVVFTNSSAAKYSAELSAASLMRKNGAAMKFSEIVLGDKVEVKGTLWGDNSISATSLRNLSLYAHNSSFSGKIISINTSNSSFVMQSKTSGEQKILTNSFTSFSVNGLNATFKDLFLGMTVAVKGQWDRNPSDIVAVSAKATYRLIDIYFTGTLFVKGPDSLTVIGNGNVIYGVDISRAIFQNKNGKAVSLSQINLGDTLRVWGRHLSGSVAILGSKIKDSSLLK